MKSAIADFTRREFLKFVEEIFIANDHGAPDSELDELLTSFSKISGHPAGTDLIYYPEDGLESSPEKITDIVSSWRMTQGLPGFKEI